jgi:hypothetical protein
MWVSRPDADNSGDHIRGHGSVSADPANPATLTYMWVPC